MPHSTSTTHAPSLANLTARHLPASPYLQQHIAVMAQQLGGELTAQHLTEQEEDDSVQREVKRAVRREMKQQTKQRTEEEQKESEADHPAPPPVYPFTAHSTALRQHVLTLSRLQTRFDTLVQSVSRSSSMHRLLSAFSSSYLQLFSSLLSTLFSLNHHYHFGLHHASFALSSQQAEHEASLSTLQHRLRLLSSATQSNHALARIELQQRQHSAQHVQHLHAILRQQAAEVQQQAQQTADQIDGSTAAAAGVKRDGVLELSAETFMQSHQLSLLLNALCYEAEEEAAERVKLDALMDEGKKSAKDMWKNTVAKKKEDAAAKTKDRLEREKMTMLAAAQGDPTVLTPRGWTAGPYTANGFTLLPVLSRFMRGMQTLMSPRGRNVASSLETVNSQLINILVALPSSVGVADFPTHLLSVIMSAQTNPQAAQRHLRSLFTHCTAHSDQPLPRLVLPLISHYTGKAAAQSLFSSGLTPRNQPRPATASADTSALPPALVPPCAFTLHAAAECLRFLQPLLAACAHRELLCAVPLLQAQVAALVAAFWAPAGSGGEWVRGRVVAWLDAQALLGAVSVVEMVLVFVTAYRECLSDFLRQELLSGKAQLGWEEMTGLMQTLCRSETRWEIAGKSEVAKVYVEWSARCGEVAAYGGSDGDVDEIGVLLDVLSLHRWFMTDVHTS